MLNLVKLLYIYKNFNRFATEMTWKVCRSLALGKQFADSQAAIVRMEWFCAQGCTDISTSIRSSLVCRCLIHWDSPRKQKTPCRQRQGVVL